LHKRLVTTNFINCFSWEPIVANTHNSPWRKALHLPQPFQELGALLPPSLLPADAAFSHSSQYISITEAKSTIPEWSGYKLGDTGSPMLQVEGSNFDNFVSWEGQHIYMDLQHG
jgi:hypothetical protein